MQDDITQLLDSWSEGSDEAKNHLFRQIYATLVEMARVRLDNNLHPVTLRPADLVHEAMVRVFGAKMRFANRAHFFALAALKMRSVLVDYARSNMAGKRGRGQAAVTLSAAEQLGGTDEDYGTHDVLAVHQALEQLSALDRRAALSVELAFFGGLERQEIAAALGVSVPTVDRDLRFAKAWLSRHL